ncbi:hypothetical protein BC832DRAFT_541721 [Gaertneriomyces semiglobifer]|nr:hypothetical protein BC832DRAFT_541721 [Gaertneriomyces semiglobifer]
MVSIELTPEHGYAIATAAASVILVQYLGFKAGSMRKVADVPYPYLYADRAEADKNPTKKIYNCYQRAHQNTLETYPGFLVFFTASAIKYPLFASVAGMTFLVGRYFYATGYWTGNPQNRMRGWLQYFGFFGLLGATVKVAYELITA